MRYYTVFYELGVYDDIMFLVRANSEEEAKQALMDDAKKDGVTRYIEKISIGEDVTEFFNSDQKVLFITTHDG